ncbi:MAG: ABC transporter ATP-binding protein [Acidimicrobiia bacterium]
MLEVEHLSVRYGEVTALDGVDLAVAAREIVSVLGPSGSGKSTLLRAVAGLAPEATGRVRWNGVDLANVPPHRREFGLMFQDHALFPHRDVIGNVIFGLRMQRRPRVEAEARARETLALVGLVGFDHRRVAELSGGEQQRVALARALAPAPRLLMLDEPLGALDRALRDRLVAELRALFVRLGVTIIFVTHDHDEAFALADRVVVMEGGRIAQSGTPADVWDHPKNAFVARFLGWNVTHAFGDGLIAVRPEGLALTPSSARTAVVTGRTFRRDHYLLEIEVGDGERLEVAVAVDGSVPEVGDTVGIEMVPGAAVGLG